MERAEVPLMLLDVEASDAEGQPLRGLTLRDLSVTLDGRAWPIYSVDDFCRCAGPTEDSTAPVGAPDTTAAAAAALEPARYVLYFDFSHIEPDSRVRATAEAKRWIESVMQSGDRAMVAAYAERAGLVTLTPFTDDKSRLAAAVDEAYGDSELIGTFSVTRRVRARACASLCAADVPVSCDTCWFDLAKEEYQHGTHAFEALKWLLRRIAAAPGHKSVVYFQQDGTIFPARRYPVKESRVGDHIALVDEVGAEATLARASIYTAFSGAERIPLAINLGANLAEFTGGGYNRGPSDLGRLVQRVGRGCACIYRIGLTPPEGASGRVHRVAVAARGRRLPSTYRVEFLSPADRWMRSAQAVLAAPETARDVSVDVAIVPEASRGDRWDLRVELVLDPASLVLLAGPGGGQSTGAWEAGALLSNAGGRRTWEMLGVSELRGTQERDVAPAVVHERVVSGVPADSYELRAFGRDRWGNTYGAARVAVDLPRAGRRAIVGPQIRRSGQRLVRTGWPLRNEASDASPTTTRAVERGSLPLGERAARPGEPLEFLTWLCPRASVATMPEVRGTLSRDDELLLRFEAPEIVPAGDCVRVAHGLDTAALAPGRYAYQLRWAPEPDAEVREVEARFEVEGPTGPVPARRATSTGSTGSRQ